MARRIVWSSPSVQDLAELYAYIGQDSRQHAKKFLRNLRKTVESLRDFPQLGRVVPELENLSVRELLMGDYRIIYRLGPEERIEIARVRRVKRLFSHKDLG